MPHECSLANKRIIYVLCTPKYTFLWCFNGVLGHTLAFSTTCSGTKSWLLQHNILRLGQLGVSFKRNLEFPARVLSVSPCITYGHLPHLKAWRLASKPHLREDQLRAKRCGEKKSHKRRTHTCAINFATICSNDLFAVLPYSWGPVCHLLRLARLVLPLFHKPDGLMLCLKRARHLQGLSLQRFTLRRVLNRCKMCIMLHVTVAGAVGRSIISIQFHNSSSHHRCKCADCQLPQLPADFVRSWWSPTFGSEPHWHGGICWQFPRWLQFRSTSSRSHQPNSIKFVGLLRGWARGREWISRICSARYCNSLFQTALWVTKMQDKAGNDS